MIEKEKFTPKTGNYKRAVGVFKRREDLQDALQDLKKSAFDMNRVSLLARNIDDVEGAREVTEKHGNEAKEGAAAGATAGTVLGGIGGFLVGVGLLAIPGVGPILAAGAEISAVASTLAGAGIGAASGGIIGALVGMGIPEERAKVYNERIKAGEYLLMVSGSDNDLKRVRSIMHDRHVEEFEIFDAPARREAREEVAEVEPVATRERVATREVVTDARDLTGDGEPEVIIVDERKEIR
ncbi:MULTISPECIES: histidine kinase [unclassified Coleofasciculus]|uniref:histidine kinase n=1 Tax=unclassified Coleofasciculus TaxID=2692782 RepID=UPI00188138AD|nr:MULTISPECIES: histidine kinase [unclassified Coleofasciculus]MBE9127138.1 histidine kinase [Coleofasciculus sp. LEGE 07081]MBE9152324.1 histidine kinase [Coleofasciculus sp. LEGE 07092]